MLVAPRVVHAQEPAGRANTGAQYVLLIDDSGSMRPIGRDPGADPDRLSVFAARSVLALLDDSDEASVVRLNAPLEEPPAAIRPLREVRGALEGMLDNGGAVARYEGRDTPCSRAFDTVRGLLNGARRPGVKQVVVYLTDGACELNRRPDGVAVDAFLGGIESYDPAPEKNEFLLYLLRFRARQYTRDLETIALRSGGASFELEPGNATGILRPFAQAISRAQGYDALELSPGAAHLAAHTSARRVRLLAVAEGAGPPLEIRFVGAVEPDLLGPPRTGVHRFEGGRTFRFVALDYRPGATGVDVEVLNAGAGWRVVAIPEYRLRLETSVMSGACDAGGTAVQVIDVGATACVRLRLVNEQGEPVESESFGGRVALTISYQAPGTDAPTDLPPNPATGAGIGGTLERARLVPGDHVFRPSALITLGNGSPFPLVGQPFTLQASSTQILATPSRWALGTLVPGASARTEVTLSGNFAGTEAVFDVANRGDIPRCVRFTVSSVSENANIPLSSGQRYHLNATVDGVCGLRSLDRDLTGSVRLTASGLPPVEIPFTGHLDYRITLPASLELPVGRDGPAHLPITVGGNSRADLHFLASFGAPGARWPGGDLELGFVAERTDQEARRNADGELVREAEVVASRTDGTRSTATLWASASPCCSEGRHESVLQLRMVGGEGEPAQIPVRLVVAKGTWWGCYGNRVLYALYVLAALLLSLFLRNLVVHSYFVAGDRLEKRLPVPQYEGGGRKRGIEEPRLRKQRGSVERALHWLLNGGLTAGFARPYREVWRISPEYENPRTQIITDWQVDDLEAPVRGRSSAPTGRRGEPQLVVVAAGLSKAPGMFLLFRRGENVTLNGHDFIPEVRTKSDGAGEGDEEILLCAGFDSYATLKRRVSASTKLNRYDLVRINAPR
jgi:hypothetical protein